MRRSPPTPFRSYQRSLPDENRDAAGGRDREGGRVRHLRDLRAVRALPDDPIRRAPGEEAVREVEHAAAAGACGDRRDVRRAVVGEEVTLGIEALELSGESGFSATWYPSGCGAKSGPPYGFGTRLRCAAGAPGAAALTKSYQVSLPLGAELQSSRRGRRSSAEMTARVWTAVQVPRVRDARPRRVRRHEAVAGGRGHRRPGGSPRPRRAGGTGRARESVGPVVRWSPVGPVGPVEPVVPVGPVGPVGPLGPVESVGCAGVERNPPPHPATTAPAMTTAQRRLAMSPPPRRRQCGARWGGAVSSRAARAPGRRAGARAVRRSGRVQGQMEQTRCSQGVCPGVHRIGMSIGIRGHFAKKPIAVVELGGGRRVRSPGAARGLHAR